LQNIGSLPPTDYTTVKYEDLCAEPALQITRVLHSLGIQAGDASAYHELIAPRRLDLLPEVARRQQSIGRKLQRYCTYHGYML
jgi:hypothetical protein